MVEEEGEGSTRVEGKEKRTDRKSKGGEAPRLFPIPIPYFSIPATSLLTFAPSISPSPSFLSLHIAASTLSA
jgi:hypothetical protein